MSQPRSSAPFLIQWVILLGALLVMGLALGSSIHQNHEAVRRNEEERLLAQAGIVERILSENLEALNAVLGRLATGAGAARGRIPDEQLKALVEGMPGVRTLLALNADGVAGAANRAELLGRDFSGRGYFQAARAGNDPDTLYVSEPFRTSLGVYSLNVVRVVRGPDGAFAGAVAATLDPDYFLPLLKAVLYAPDMWAHLVHGGGAVLLVVPEREGVEGRNLARPGTLFTRHRDSGRSSSIFADTVWVTGERRMLAVRTISPAGLKLDTSLVVGVARDLDAVFADWRADSLWRGGLFLLLTLLAMAGLAAYQMRQRQHDRREAESAAALLKSERFMRTVADSLPGMVGYWDRNLRCGFANRAYKEWFGLDADEMLGMHIQDLMGEALFALNRPYMLAALEGEPQQFERAMRKVDGSLGHTLAHYVPDVVEGEVRGFFVLVSDVTELKSVQLDLEGRVEARTAELRRTMEELGEAKLQAEAASRLKSEFLANLSHELRTPLNPIIALTELVLDSSLDQRQREYLEEVRTASLRLLTLFNRLIELLELEDSVASPGPVSLAAVRDMALAGVAAAAKDKGLELAAELDPELPEHVWSDMGLLRMAVLELLENAVRFTSQGRVDLRLSSGQGEGADSRLLRITVADTGPGVPPERQQAVLTGLTQGDAPLTKRFGGLGVGLAKVRKAMDLLGGRLELESAPGRGSVFSLVLPLRPFDLAAGQGVEYVCGTNGICTWRLG